MKPKDKQVIDPSFSSTELMESLSTLKKKAELRQAGAASDASARSTAEFAELAAQRARPRIAHRLSEVARPIVDWVRANVRRPPSPVAVAGGAILFVLAWALVASPMRKIRLPAQNSENVVSRWIGRLDEPLRSAVQRSLASGDRISAVLYLRSLKPEGKGVAPAMMARAAIDYELRDPADALDAMEQAVKLNPDLAGDSMYTHLAVQTFAAGRLSRTQALIGRAPRDHALRELRLASNDWSYRVRHGAVDLMRIYGAPAPDEVAIGLLDLWQADNCEARRSIAAKLLSKGNDDRIAPALEAISHRQDDGCLSTLTARARTVRR